MSPQLLRSLHATIRAATDYHWPDELREQVATNGGFSSWSTLVELVEINDRRGLRYPAEGPRVGPVAAPAATLMPEPAFQTLFALMLTADREDWSEGRRDEAAAQRGYTNWSRFLDLIAVQDELRRPPGER